MPSAAWAVFLWRPQADEVKLVVPNVPGSYGIAERLMVLRKVANPKIVGPINNNVDIRQEVFGVAPSDVLRQGLNGDVTIGHFQLLCGCFGLCPPHLRVLFIVQRLTLQVGRFHDVPIDEADESDAGPHQLRRGDRTESSHPDYRDARSVEPSLANRGQSGPIGAKRTWREYLSCSIRLRPSHERA